MKKTTKKWLFSARNQGFILALFLSLMVSSSFGQSLDPRNPSPMKPGPNSGQVTNFTGANYFYFLGGPGEVRIHVTFRPISNWNAPGMTSTITVEAYDEHRTWVVKRALSASTQPSDMTLTGTLKQSSRIMVAIVPQNGGLIRNGGDYEVEALGAAKFGTATVDPIAGTYAVIQTNMLREEGAAKFLPDGTLMFTSGTRGKWVLFDEAAMVYTISYNGLNVSLKLLPGRGLVDPSSPSIMYFQLAR